jgi:hypothetical protein
MLRLIEAYTPDLSPVRVQKLTCSYQAQKEGVCATVDFEVLKHPDGTQDAGEIRGADGAEIIEFTFVMLDMFDNFLSSIQGIAGPGKYQSGAKKSHKAKWVFDVDGAFTQYHALCFPSQVRLSDGTVWRCNRDEIVHWLNGRIMGCGTTVTTTDIFPDNFAREGIIE